MNQFLGTLIIVLVFGFVMFFFIEIKDAGKTTEERGYSTVDNALYSFGACSIAAILGWLLIFAAHLLHHT